MLRWIRTRLNRDDGVSLVEMLVAMLIVGFVLMALASTTTASLASMRGTERHTRGTHYGNELVERMHSLGWNDLTFYASDCPAPAARPACTPEQSAATPMFEGNAVVRVSTARPAGSRAPLPTEWVTTAGPEGSVRYAVTRYITWIDDPSDGTAAAGTDSNAQDYKRLTVLLNWTVDGVARSQRFDSHRAPPLDGPTATSPFRITKVAFLPSRSIVLNAAKQSTTGSVTIEVTVSRVASGVTVQYRPDGQAWTQLTPVGTTDNLVWTAVIPETRIWNPEGYWDFRVVATSPAGETDQYDEKLWIAQTGERFVAILDFSASPATRLDRYMHNNNASFKDNHNTNCHAIVSWTVVRTDPADVVSTSMTAATYHANGTVAMAPWTLPIYQTTTLTSTSVRYTAGIPAGTKITSGDTIVFTARASNAAGDHDTVKASRLLTYNQGCA